MATGKPSQRRSRPARHPPRRAAQPAPRPSVDLGATFAALKALLVRHERHLVVVHDAPDQFYLNTRKPGPDGKPLFFGAVELKRYNVLYRLLPLHVDPALVSGLSPALRKHLQGKADLAFTGIDPPLIEELDRITRAGMASFERKGLA
jgi:hypothetical protein